MKIQKDKLTHVLSTLADAFPGVTSNWAKLQQEVGEPIELTGYLVYLKDHDYIAGDMKFAPLSSHPWKVELNTIRITARGLDYLEELKDPEDVNASGSGMFTRKRRS